MCGMDGLCRSTVTVSIRLCRRRVATYGLSGFGSDSIRHNGNSDE